MASLIKKYSLLFLLLNSYPFFLKKQQYYSFFTFISQKKFFAKQTLTSILVVSIYLGWRIFLFGSISPHKFWTTIPNSPSTASITERLINTPEIILFYLKTFLFPKDLAVSQLWWNSTINFSSFYLPLIIELSILLFLS